MSSQSVTDGSTVIITVHEVRPDGGPGDTVAHGFLTGAATVLVPDPPEVLASPWRRLLVRVSRSPGTADTAQLVPVAGIGLAAVDGDGITTAAATLTLVRPPKIAFTLPKYTSAQLAAALARHHGDQWAAYAALGFRVVRPELPGAPEKWWLDSASAGLTDGGVSTSVKGYAMDACCSSPMCTDCQYGSDQPRAAAA
ncbi:hypothetical protein [Kitasatospora sp. NPDC093806]|uniref:hypothetical protein n=1 Tax=Kitasatospora sp. NPDC093806 TaxID=3155075 RepID=UPI003427F2C5